MQNLHFDKEQAIEILDSINKISGLGATLFSTNTDDSVNILFTTDSCKGMCPQCSTQSNELWNKPCQNTHAAAARFADRFGGRYFYQCKQDRIFFSAPIIADGGMVATMVIGPVHIFDAEEAHSNDESYRSFPIRKPIYIQYLSNLLAYCAVSVSDSSQTHIRLMKEAAYDQQSNIGTLLQRNKNEIYKEYPIEKEGVLAESIIKADLYTAKITLNEILAILLSGSFYGTNKSLSSSIFELKTVCGRAAIKAGVSSSLVFRARNQYDNAQSSLTKREELCLHIQSYVECMINLVERLKDVEYFDDIYRATEYIRMHYMERLTLEQVAKELAFSPSYFSRLFKKKIGLNFSTYLNEVRIEASKTALLSTNIPANEIARHVGYDDASYFTRVFKRYVGVSPGYYRNHRGRFDKNKEFGNG